jgi:cytochrome c oxidase subunit 2
MAYGKGPSLFRFSFPVKVDRASSAFALIGSVLILIKPLFSEAMEPNERTQTKQIINMKINVPNTIGSFATFKTFLIALKTILITLYSSCKKVFLKIKRDGVIIANGFFVANPVWTFADAPQSWQVGFQDPATPVMQGLIDLHHDVAFFMLVVLIFVLWLGTRTLYHFYNSKNPKPEKIIHGTTIEIAWTVAPSIILLFIAIPSCALFYSLDEVVDPVVTIKAIGHQWYWSYEYSDYNQTQGQTIAFDSYMVPEDDLAQGQLRLLEVDNRVVVPVNTHIRMIITAADVLHSWAVPSLGVKCDAIPGRLNQVPLFIKREGVFYGQCSELCGANHAFMPIVVEAVSLESYISWVTEMLSES